MRTIDRAGALCLLVILGCGGPTPGSDGGPRDGGGVDAPPAQCERNADCTDSIFCTEHACMPGAPSADARGCVLEDGPCAPGEMCIEGPPGMCVAQECTGDPDPDDDDEPSVACGGHDCDDEDGNRYPGNAEVCDAEGHDEDCLPDTIAGEGDGDLDGDGYVSAACCNGATCGDDCDDDDPSIHPGARELCNGRDDDCNGAVDDAGATPLCPGGTCTAGRCDLMEWSRTFGGSGNDGANAVDMDDSGNVYVTGYFTGTASFGSADGPVSSVPTPGGAPSVDVFVACYAADGRFRWVRTFGSPQSEVAFDIAHDPISDRVFFTLLSTGTLDFGAGSRTGMLLVVLESDGSYVWDRAFTSSGPPGLLFVDALDGPVVTGPFAGTVNLGGSDRSATSVTSAFVARYGPDGTHRWDYTSSGSATARITPFRVSMTADGITVAGKFAGGSADFGLGPRANQGNNDAFAVRLDSSGTLVWDYTAGGAGDDTAFALQTAPDGRSVLVGSFQGTVDFGGGPIMAPATESAFLARLQPDGSLDRVARWGGTGTANDASGVAISSTGDVLVSGTFSGNVDFGGGIATAPASGAAYLVVFDAALNHFRDYAFTSPGFPASPCPRAGGCASMAWDVVIGPADSTVLAGAFEDTIQLGSTSRTSAGGTDGFLFRFAH